MSRLVANRPLILRVVGPTPPRADVRGAVSTEAWRKRSCLDAAMDGFTLAFIPKNFPPPALLWWGSDSLP
ncbi:MAG: hypothetical protein ABW346_08455, partial [Terrimicrobium sp.]